MAGVASCWLSWKAVSYVLMLSVYPCAVIRVYLSLDSASSSSTYPFAGTRGKALPILILVWGQNQAWCSVFYCLLVSSAMSLLLSPAQQCWSCRLIFPTAWSSSVNCASLPTHFQSSSFRIDLRARSRSCGRPLLSFSEWLPSFCFLLPPLL